MSLSTDDKIREYVMKKAQQREHARQLREARKSLVKQDNDDIVQSQYPAASKDAFGPTEDTNSHYTFWGKDDTSRAEVGTRVAPAKTFTNPNRIDNSYAGVSAVPSHVRTSIGMEQINISQPSPKYATMEDLEKVKSLLDQLQGQMHSLQFQIDNLKYSNQRLTDQVAFWQREAAEASARGGNLKSNSSSNNNNSNSNNNNNNNNNLHNMQSDMGYGSSSYGGGYMQSRNVGQQSSPSVQNSNNSAKPMSVDTRLTKTSGDNLYGNNNSNKGNNNINSGNNSSSNLYNRNKSLSSQNMVGEKSNQNKGWATNSNNNSNNNSNTGNNTTRNNGPTAMDIDSRSESSQMNGSGKSSNGRATNDFRPFGSNTQNNAEGSNAPAFTFQTRENSSSKLAQHEPMDTSADKLSTNDHNFREQESDAENQVPAPSSAADILNKLGPDAYPDPQINCEKVECPQCGRKFNSDTALEKHVKACMKKRKAFDASKMRMDEEALKAKTETDASADKNKKNDKWKNQSGALREAIKAAREYNQAKKEGRDPPPPTQSTVPDTRVACPYCGRKFNEDAAERHIPKCKNIKSKPKPLGKK